MAQTRASVRNNLMENNPNLKKGAIATRTRAALGEVGNNVQHGQKSKLDGE